ncbi:Hypothetical protein HDN1F_33760 [gamma proteobacterium HdN1]|nr:Hypothetical protein HDN1F_33760 [gamma proteobacterium HdN1]
MLAVPASVYADEALEKKFAAFQSQTTNQIRSLKRQIQNEQEKFKINGFATAGITRSDNKNRQYLRISENDIDDTNNTLADSNVGIQLTFKPLDKMEFVTQILAQAKEQWEPTVTWAYLKYQLDPQFAVKAGKMRLPYYLASEYIDVGYSYHWVRPPSELYSVFIDNYTGVELEHRFNLGGGWVNQAKMFYGGVGERYRGHASEESATTDAFDFGMENVRGIEERIFWGPLLLRASYTAGKFRLVVPGYEQGWVYDRDYRYIVGGVQYDDGGLYFTAEYANSEIEDYSKNKPYTTTLGYNIGNTMPYITLSRVNDKDQVFGDTQQKSILLGVRYYVNGNISLKAGIQRFSDFGDTDGQFSWVGGGNSWEAPPIEKSVKVYSFSVNSVF